MGGFFMQQLQGEVSNPRQKSATAAFHAGLLDESVAARWTFDFLHTDGKKCPYCKVAITDDARLKRWYRGGRVKCSSPDCGRFYTSRTGTLLDGSTLTPSEFYLLKVLIENEVSVSNIAAIIPVNQETVKRWAQRIHELESLSA
jgi:transposase-like protein